MTDAPVTRTTAFADINGNRIFVGVPARALAVPPLARKYLAYVDGPSGDVCVDGSLRAAWFNRGDYVEIAQECVNHLHLEFPTRFFVFGYAETDIVLAFPMPQQHGDRMQREALPSWFWEAPLSKIFQHLYALKITVCRHVGIIHNEAEEEMLNPFQVSGKWSK